MVLYLHHIGLSPLSLAGPNHSGLFSDCTVLSFAVVVGAVAVAGVLVVVVVVGVDAVLGVVVLVNVAVVEFVCVVDFGGTVGVVGFLVVVGVVGAVDAEIIFCHVAFGGAIEPTFFAVAE